MLIQGKKHTYQAKAGEGEDGGGGNADPDLDKDKGGEGGDDADTVAPEIEEKARKMGWTPKDEFRGDPEKWRDAKEFVDRGENMLPIMRKTAERNERRIGELEQTIRDLAEYNSKADQRAFERALKELKEKQVAAVKAGDADAFVEVDEAIAELHKEAKDKPVIKIPDPGEDPEYLEWEGRNKWIKDDPELGAYADMTAAFLRNVKKDKRVGTPFLEAVKEAVKREYPDKFRNARREAPGAVEGNSPPAKKGGKSYADLPADARAACDRMARNGYADKPKEMAEFKAQYVRNYFEE